MKRLINGFSMAYTDQGQGKPLLLVHGYPLNRQMWAPQILGLSRVARVIAPDLRGHGDSEAVPGPYSMELFADDLAALLDSLEIQQKVICCGLSMGGYAVFAFQRKYPERIAALILTATRAADDTPQARAARDQAAELARRNQLDQIFEGMLPKLLSEGNYHENPELVEQVRSIMRNTSQEGVLGDLAGLKDRPDSRPSLPDIKVPTLILHGADDRIVPVTEAKEMLVSIPNSQLQIIPAAGHLLNLEQPEIFNRAVIGFLSTLESQPS